MQEALNKLCSLPAGLRAAMCPPCRSATFHHAATSPRCSGSPQNLQIQPECNGTCSSPRMTSRSPAPSGARHLTSGSAFQRSMKSRRAPKEAEPALQKKLVRSAHSQSCTAHSQALDSVQITDHAAADVRHAVIPEAVISSSQQTMASLLISYFHRRTESVFPPKQ